MAKADNYLTKNNKNMPRNSDAGKPCRSNQVGHIAGDEHAAADDPAQERRPGDGGGCHHQEKQEQLQARACPLPHKRAAQPAAE